MWEVRAESPGVGTPSTDRELVLAAAHGLSAPAAGREGRRYERPRTGGRMRGAGLENADTPPVRRSI